MCICHVLFWFLFARGIYMTLYEHTVAWKMSSFISITCMKTLRNFMRTLNQKLTTVPDPPHWNEHLLWQHLLTEPEIFTVITVWNVCAYWLIRTSCLDIAQLGASVRCKQTILNFTDLHFIYKLEKSVWLLTLFKNLPHRTCCSDLLLLCSHNNLHVKLLLLKWSCV